jgi:electron transport complex protein RnfA
MLLWFFFAYALNFFILSSLEWLLIFPLSALLCRFFEFCFSRFFPEIAGEARLFSARSAYDGLITALLLITLRAALSPLEAVALSLGFASGGFLAALILTAILRRSVIEAVPPSLRGTPLLFISMGLLSLVSASAAAALLRVFSFS